MTHEYETAVISDLDVRSATRISDLRAIFRRLGFSRSQAEKMAAYAWDLLRDLQGMPGVPEIAEPKDYSELAVSLKALTATIKEATDDRYA